MIQTYVFILIVYFTAAYYCNIDICLTWNVQGKHIAFQCKVDNLRMGVEFRNPSNEEEGFCVMPVSTSYCLPMNNNNILQNLTTNTTVLILNRHIDDSLNGPWTCFHGTNIHGATVFVNVFKSDNCSDEFLGWTYIGAAGCILSCFVIWVVWNICAKHLCETKMLERKGIVLKNEFFNDHLKSFTITMLGIASLLIPYFGGTAEQKCEDKYYFCIYGFLVVLMVVMCISVLRKRKGLVPVTLPPSTSNENNKPKSDYVLDDANEPPPNCEETSRQQLLSDANEPKPNCEKPSRQHFLSKDD